MKTYLFPPIAEGDLIHEAAHGFMGHLQFIREDRVDELRSDRNGMKEEVEQWLDFELRCAVENAREEPNGGESHFMFDGVGVADIEKIVDIIFVTLGDRPSSDLGFYNYSDDERMDDEANILLKIENSISAGNTKLIKPHAIFGSLNAFGRKCDDIIDSAHGLAEHLGHIEERSYTEDQVFRPRWLTVGLLPAFPSHFHSAVVAKVLENGARELALVARNTAAL